MERILAIQVKQIGDMILTVPALQVLRRVRPDAHISLVVKGQSAPLGPCIPYVDEVLVHRANRPNLRLWRRLVTRRYDYSLDFNGTDRAALITTLAKARERITYAKHAQRFPRTKIFTCLNETPVSAQHTIDYFIALLGSLGIEGERAGLTLNMPDGPADETMDLLQSSGCKEPCAVIHPGTAWEEKYWEPERWGRIIDELALQRGYSVVITGGMDPREKIHISRILHSAVAGDRVLDLSGKLSLLESAAVISHCHLALGVDTAAMHMASAFHRPQVVLFGPTNPFRWAPRHSKAAVVRPGFPLPTRDFEREFTASPMVEISTAQVIRAIDTVTS